MLSKEQNKFKEIFDIQKEFTKKYFDSKNVALEDIKNNEDQLVRWNKEYILSILKETTDLLDKLDWKMISSCIKPSDISDNVLEECIDIFKYLLGLMILNGFSEEEIVTKFIEKSNVVEARFEQEKSLREILKDKNKKIAFIDIDGVIADWPKCFISFINRRYNKTFSSLKEISNRDLIKYKLSYRTSGEKKNIPTNSFSSEFTAKLREKNYFVILLTSRPYKKVFRIYSDTIDWLKKNDVKYDAIIWNENKEDFVIRHFSEHNVDFVIDDDLENILKLANKGFRVVLKFNKDRYDSEYVEKFLALNNIKTIINIDSLSEMEKIIND